MRPRRYDCFPFAGSETELLLLECRLTELYDVFDAFVVVEATVDHQYHPKELNYLEYECRFAPWRDKIVYVVADGLPSPEEAPGPWGREHAQREWIAQGLEEIGADDDDIVFQSDADEIPSPLAARNVTPHRNQMISLHQRGHFWAIDWLYPFDKGWRGTVAARYGAIKTLADARRSGPFAAMRDSRNRNPHMQGGWHFSWLGGPDAWTNKVRSFCHPEVEDRLSLHAEKYWREGWHVDGEKMTAVDVDRTWPVWMQEGSRVPENWYRPRDA